MSQKQTQHSHNVVEAFKGKLSTELRDQIGDSKFSALELLVESAISTAVLEELEKAADRVEKLSHDIRTFAESYDS